MEGSVGDPGTLDVLTTRLLGRTLLRPFWRGWVGRLGIQSGERVLDFGSGSGQLSRRLALAVGPTGHVTCLDVSTRWLELARRELSDLEWVSFHLGSPEQVDRAAYDLVHVHYVLHDLPRVTRGDILAILMGRLREGARLAVREPLYYGTLDVDELLALTERLGLELLSGPARRWWLAGPVVEAVYRSP